MILALLDESVANGARLTKSCELVHLSVRTVQRWRAEPDGEDRRRGPDSKPAHQLSAQERQAVLNTANSPEFRDKSPRQIVPTLADRGEYIASESTFYRILHAEGLMRHREPARPRTHNKPTEHVATAPNQV